MFEKYKNETRQILLWLELDVCLDRVRKMVTEWDERDAAFCIYNTLAQSIANRQHQYTRYKS